MLSDSRDDRKGAKRGARGEILKTPLFFGCGSSSELRDPLLLVFDIAKKSRCIALVKQYNNLMI